MRRSFRFFFGSPARFTATALTFATLALIHYFAPGVLWSVANGVIEELSPLLSMLLYYGLVFFFIFLGFRIMLKPWLGKK
jgi:hypothetical protein